MGNTKSAPALGSARAAVESYVNLMSTALSKDETILHYWLDTYYQLRLAYEMGKLPAASAEAAEHENEAEPQTAKKKPAPPGRKVVSEEDKAFKREVVARLVRAREMGITMPELEKANTSGDRFSPNDMLVMLDRGYVGMSKYKGLKVALDNLNIPGPEA